MISSKTLKEIVSEARPIIERQLDDAEMIAGLRDVVAGAGGDWSALKALIKAQIQDERDETGNGKRVAKILEKAGFSTGYADMLGWSKMNENNFSAEEEFDPVTGEFVDDGPVTIIDQTDRDGHHIKVTVDPEIAEILARVEADRASACLDIDGSVAGQQSNKPETANEPPAFLTKPPSPLRPHCRQPEECGGYGRNHCHTCAKAMEREMA